MTITYLPDVALADVAIEAESETVAGLFESCALAITDIMVDPATLKPETEKRFRLEAPDLDRLLYDFLTELIVVKDVDSLIFKEFSIQVDQATPSLSATAWGEPIDRGRHRLRNDVKAVTMHLFGIKREGGKWKTDVVLDI